MSIEEQEEEDKMSERRGEKTRGGGRRYERCLWKTSKRKIK